MTAGIHVGRCGAKSIVLTIKSLNRLQRIRTISTMRTGVVTKQTIEELEITPPSDRIPLEILQNVFLILLSWEQIPILDELNTNPSTSLPESNCGSLVLPRVPSTLSSVCSRWRSCAHGMPDMWNVLFIKAPRLIQGCSKSFGAEGIMKIGEARLSLSQSMPLKICLASTDNLVFAQSIIRSIIPFSRRWTTIHLYTPRAAYAELKYLQPADVPLLVTLTTYSPTHSAAANTFKTLDIEQFSFFNKISSIKQFSTSNVIPSPSSSIYAALQELSIQSCRSETWLIASVLSSCSQLKALTLSGYGVTTYTATNPEAQLGFVLPKLEILALEHPVGREQLLDLLISPNLKSLWLGGRCSGPSTLSVLNSISRLKERSKVDSLEYLSLFFEMHSMDPAMLIDLLRSNHAIRVLQIDDTFKNFNRALITPSLFDALTKTTTRSDCPPYLQQTLLCSQLEHINFTVNGCSIFECSELAAFLEARCRVSSVLAESYFGRDYSLAPVTQLEVMVKRPGKQSPHEIVRNWRRKGYFVGLKVVE